MAPLIRQSGSTSAYWFSFILGSPSSAGYQSDSARVGCPLTPTWCNCWLRRMFQALGVPDRYPAVSSVSRYSVRQCVRAPLVERLGCASAAGLSPTRCALAVGEPIPFMDSCTSV